MELSWHISEISSMFVAGPDVCAVGECSSRGCGQVRRASHTDLTPEGQGEHLFGDVWLNIIVI